MDDQFYADIIVPGSLANSYTYSLGKTGKKGIDRGTRVIIPFGKNRIVAGVVARVHNEKPSYKGLKDIIAVAAYIPRINHYQLDLWEWISRYYMCARGEVMDAALPAGLKTRKGKAIENNISGVKYRPMTVPYVTSGSMFDDDEPGNVLDKLARYPARHKLFNYFLSEALSAANWQEYAISKDELLRYAGVSVSTLKKLVDDNILTLENREVERIKKKGLWDDKSLTPPVLSKAQEKTINTIRTSFSTMDVVLLKGVTSSGKTEIYIHLIREQMERGKQVLYLLPEIALTSQIINRLRKWFGDDIGVYHSRYTDNERVEVWRKLNGEYPGSRFNIILGVRSSVFLPFDNLGLVIVDEEHDPSYKQHDPAPRYNARDSAIVLAKMHGAKVLLGSATPSLESVYNCLSGKYALVELNERYGQVKLPGILVSDTAEAYRRKIMISHFTPLMIRSVEETLARGEQVVFFKNRRGYAPLLMCNECGWSPQCPDCSVNLTYHKGINRLRCHYCGKTLPVSKKCDNCGSNDLRMKGFGTEKIEDEIKALFDGAKVLRLDTDAARKKGAADKIIRQLENGEIDILVGTQMIAKGLDFENLTLVGILNVDNMLMFPDFRAAERCFQLIEQVSGRAGRRSKTGKVIIQTNNPASDVLRQAVKHDYWSMYQAQIEERREFGYPPFTRLVKIFTSHKDRKILIEASRYLAAALRKYVDIPVLGPEFPPVDRKQSYYIMSILLKIERDRNDLAGIKRIIKKAIDNTYDVFNKGNMRIYADVDPV